MFEWFPSAAKPSDWKYIDLAPDGRLPNSVLVVPAGGNLKCDLSGAAPPEIPNIPHRRQH
jgi:hypothetical protein